MRQRVRNPLVLVATLFWVAAGATATVGLTEVPAAAASGRCAPEQGVTVVVEYDTRLHRSTVVACDSHGGGSEVAWDRTEHAGQDLDEVVNEPGFACSINKVPDPAKSCQRTPPSDAYWGLFWSDGTSTKWNYSSTGARGLKIPEGGSVGWRWQNGGSLDYPRTAPTTAKPSSTPSPTPTPTPHHNGGSGGADGSGDGSGDGDAGKGAGNGTGGSPDATPSQPPSSPSSPSPKERRDQVRPAGPSEGTGGDPGDRPGGDEGDPSGKDRPDDKGGDDKAQPPDHSDSDQDPKDATDDTVATTAGSADVLEDAPAKPGPGDGVLTAAATTSVVLLGAAVGIIGWRRRS